MAALRDIARDFAAEIRDGIGWTIVYRTGRSWNALTIWSDIWNGEWETDDLNEAIGILKADPDAVIVNGYYCGHFGEDMTIDEIAAGIRWHYCHPYRPSERGSNENQNGLIRRHLPKGTDLSTVSYEETKRIEDWLNNYPRKMFGYLCSEQLFREEIALILAS